MTRRQPLARSILVLATFGWVVGCASTSATNPDSPEAPSTSPTTEESAGVGAGAQTRAERERPRELPVACADPDSDICTPPTSFTERLCRSTHPEVALAMFRKDSPWTRAYLRGNMEAWYTEARSRPRELRFSEEVIIVKDRASGQGGIRVSGSGSYDVLRWDGSCVSLMSDEVSMRPPSVPRVAPIPWRKLGQGIREQLLTDTKVALRAEHRKTHCKKDPSGKRCATAEEGLSQIIAHYLRQGGEIPDPRRLP